MPPVPQATTGSLASKPLAHLLAYLLDKELSGSLRLTASNGAEASTMLFVRGEVAKVRTTAPVAYLGAVLYEMGLIDSEELNASLRELSERKIPHGEILLSRGSITKRDLIAGLREQTLRKLCHLFGLDGATTFSFYNGADLLEGYGGRDRVLVDPVPAIRLGVLEFPSVSHVRDMLLRIGRSRCRIALGAQIERFRFPADELRLVDALRIKPMDLDEIRALGVLPPQRVELLVYCLLITKQITLLEPAVAVSTPPISRPVDTRRASPPPSQAPRRHSSTYRLRAVSQPAVEELVPVRTTSSASRVARPEPPARPPPSAIRDELFAREQTIRARAVAIQDEDFFQRLSVPRDATRAQIDQAFEAFASLWNAAELPPELDGVRLECERVYLALMEAHSTLSDSRRRAEYLRHLLLAPAHDPAKDLAASGADSDFAGAKACLAKNDLERAERLARRANKASPHDAAALALLAWIEATSPANQSIEATRVRIAMLDRAVDADPECEEALYFRAQLHKRTQNHRLAIKDLTRVVALNPRNVDASRELRIYEMRIRHGSIKMQAVRKDSPAAGTAGLAGRWPK